MSKNTPRKADTRCFVETGQRPSVGVEVSTGRPWVGVDQQVGHGSADALFALTDAQYPAALRNELGAFQGECWRGERDDLLLFRPGGSGSWRPKCWNPVRSRVIPPRFAGELWRHIDALGTAIDSDEARTARELAGDAVRIEDTAGVIDGIVFRLTGEGAYPRPAGLISGLTAGSDREQVRAILGAPLEGTSDVFAVEGDHLRLAYGDDGLGEMALTRPAPVPLPAGRIRDFLTVLGEPERGAAFARVARLAGGASTRWAGSSGFGRRLVVFDGGVDLQVEAGRVISARVDSNRVRMAPPIVTRMT